MDRENDIASLLRKAQVSLTELSSTIGLLASQLESEPNGPRLNFISEAEMAFHLGISKKALQARRTRGQIPETVWHKVGRNVVYSLKHYEDWLDGVWLSAQKEIIYETPKTIRPRKPRPGHNRPVFRLT